VKFKNKTDYDTNYLRRLFRACLKSSKTKITQRVVVAYTKANHIKGADEPPWIILNASTKIIILLPKPHRCRTFKTVGKEIVWSPFSTAPSAYNVAQLFTWIIKRLKNHGVPSLWHHVEVDWPKEFVPLSSTPKPKKDIISIRAAKANKLLEQWDRKFRQAKNKLVKYQKLVKYYERKLK
jgi:hypothetical protein